MRPLPAFLLALAAAPAAAQDDPPPPTPAQVAAAKAEGARMIVEAKAGGVFVNETLDDTVQLRHRQSGMLCRFITGAKGSEIQVEPGQPRGDMVSCNAQVAGVAITVSATRDINSATAEQAAQAWAASIREQFPAARPAEGEPAHFKTTEPPPTDTRLVRVSFELDGLPLYMRASVAVCGPWLVEESSTSRIADAHVADVTGEVALLQAARPICAANRAG